MVIKSPLTSKENSLLIEEISSESIVKNYSDVLRIDVRIFFNGVETFQIYKCRDSGYRFFYPFDINGNDNFYQQLEKFDWYYMPWKWEHEVTKESLNGNEKILEVGSGGLGFLRKMSNLGFDITGLELNSKSVTAGQKENLKVINKTIEEYSDYNAEEYDVVCSYQVLEHISTVNSFVSAQIKCLKPGGKLIISVPNNDSFIKYSKGGVLNFPPHHMGWWDERSLRSLEKIYSLQIEKVFYEPLQKYHFGWYLNTVIIPKVNKYKLARKVYSKFGDRRFIEFILRYFNKYIKGHSIMIIYKKIA